MASFIARLRGRSEAIEAELWRRRHQRVLRQMRTREDLQAYINKVKPEYFMMVAAASEARHRELESVLETLDLQPRGLDVLDIGPGYGDVLDYCHQRGARSCSFVDRDPFFVAHNRLKGFPCGYDLDHLRHLNHLPPKAFDFVWAKGSVSADYFQNSRRWATLERWLDHLRGLVRDGGHVVVCPHFEVHAGIRSLPDWRKSAFADRLMKRGFMPLPPVPRHNDDRCYPVTFHRVGR